MFAEILILACFCTKLFLRLYYNFHWLSQKHYCLILLSYIPQRRDEILNLTHEHEIMYRDSFYKIIVCNVINKKWITKKGENQNNL